MKRQSNKLLLALAGFGLLGSLVLVLFNQTRANDLLLTWLKPGATRLVPAFDHIVLIVLENHEYSSIDGSPDMPYLNNLARENTLLSRYYSVAHPSLPNYLALIGGDTFGIRQDCVDCYIHAQTLADQIESSGRAWRGYMEDMPSACYYDHNQQGYALRHNPFIYFDNIRTNTARCQKNVVPLEALPADLSSRALPDFAFISPNTCNDGHDCPLSTTDAWLANWVPLLLEYPGMKDNGLLVITFDEGTSNRTCCGVQEGGGHVFTVLVSPQARKQWTDTTPYNHYALLKTISTAWGFSPMGQAGSDETPLISAPWR